MEGMSVGNGSRDERLGTGGTSLLQLETVFRSNPGPLVAQMEYSESYTYLLCVPNKTVLPK